MKFREWVVVAASACLLATTPASTQEKPVTGCHDARSRHFDFWIGEWQVTEGGKAAGVNRIESILDGCALLENWTGGSGFSGKSLNHFDRADGRWHQLWIDGSGGVLSLAGGFANGAMRLEGSTLATPKQPAQRHRITWTPHADGTVRQLWEAAPTGKNEWKVQFDGLYLRPSR
ncbi:MAG TPA: hypothetical protein VFS58_12655 [Steroidobacteraceae bacterium]|nr:hypothetical protein [Steroidobacteraceae bacterium]